MSRNLFRNDLPYKIDRLDIQINNTQINYDHRIYKQINNSGKTSQHLYYPQGSGKNPSGLNKQISKSYYNNSDPLNL